MSKKTFKNLEWVILICSVILLFIGLIALFSATQDGEYEEFRKQIIWALISIPIMIASICVDYNFITKISPLFYAIAIIALIGVLFTEPINGATSWYQITETINFQPSEFAKIILVIFLSYIITKLQKEGKTEINKIWKLGIILLSAGVPMLLIVIEPDYRNSGCFYFCRSIYAFCFRNRQKICDNSFCNYNYCITIVISLYFTRTRKIKNRCILKS